MNPIYGSYNAFISSPGDVNDERKIAEDVIEKVNIRIRDALNMHLAVKKWENLPPETPQISNIRFQDELNNEVKKAHFFILILYKRYGSIEPGSTISNTEREIDAIIEKKNKNPKIKILAYFKEIPENKDKGEQEKKIIELQEKLKEIGVVHTTFTNAEDFRIRFSYDLFEVLMKLKVSSFKKEMLKNFWQLGVDAEGFNPKLYVLYPPVQREMITEGEKEDFWLRRLASTMYFEDYKAIDKITQSLSSIGFYNWHVNSISDLPSDYLNTNRVWICLPRSRIGKNHLKRYGERSIFSLIKKEGNQNVIDWKSEGGIVHVNSPLSKYLFLQRTKMNIVGDWRPEFGRIIAKDYAVVARFSVENEDKFYDEPLYEYFIFGIRGLGTWGAAWFIDRRSNYFKGVDEHIDIQFLLEVHFQDNHIVDVRNVSDMNQEYFDTENATTVIDKRIQNQSLIDEDDN